MIWTWPWSFLSMPLILIPYLNHAFDIFFSEFEPSGSIILVPRAQNVKKNLTSDLTLTLHVTSILSSLKWFWSVLSRAFAWSVWSVLSRECRLARLSTNNGSRDSTGGVISPPGNQGCASSPGGDGLTLAGTGGRGDATPCGFSGIFFV